MGGFFRWFFAIRETGAITIAQAPNLSLWIVIVVGVWIWAGHPPDRAGVILEIIFKGALFVWAVDEILRGVNPWRRCLGVAVLCYGLWKLIATLARALMREDAGFHAYQMLEAGVRQYNEWGNTNEGRHILIAVARYLAAHSPTERATLQTADIARRLMRGGELHQEAVP